MGAVLIALDELTVDAGINPRAGGVNAAHAADIAEFLTQNPGRDTPPAVAYRDPADCTHWLSEGFHRHAGYRDAGRTHIPCEVRDGDRTAAALNAAGSNKDHTVLKRSPEDKRQAVKLALLAAPDWSDRRIAEHVGVSHPIVAEVRAELTTQQVEKISTCQPTKRIGKDGKAYKVPATEPKKNEKPQQQPEPVSQDDEPEADEANESTPGQGGTPDNPPDAMLYVRPRQSVAEDVQKEIKRLKDFRLFVSTLWSNEHFRPAVDAAAERNGIRWEWDGDSESTTRLQAFTLAHKTCTCDQLTALAHFAADLHSLLLRPETSDGAPWEDRP